MANDADAAEAVAAADEHVESDAVAKSNAHKNYAAILRHLVRLALDDLEGDSSGLRLTSVTGATMSCTPELLRAYLHDMQDVPVVLGDLNVRAAC